MHCALVRSIARRLVCPALAGALLAGSLAADTWVVDASGGPGSDFTDIPPAIAAAVSGDVILVLFRRPTDF